jgi:hypothetical protein
VSTSTRKVIFVLLALAFLVLGVINLSRGVVVIGLAYCVCSVVLGLTAAKLHTGSGRH